MNTPKHTDKRATRRWTIAAVLAAVLTVAAGAAAFAGAGPALHARHGHEPMSPDALKAHIETMIAQCAADAGSDRKARLVAIANAAIDELGPTHEQFRRDHARAHALLTASVVDRAALEQWRTAQIQLMDIMSRRVLTAAEDAAELLSPEQRASCAGRLGMPMH
jgi:Spy/CpxP family protein refolding chaperone